MRRDDERPTGEVVDLHRRYRDVLREIDVENRTSDPEAFDDLRRRMEYVKDTREYPTTFTMGSQIVVSLVLPKAVQVILAGI